MLREEENYLYLGILEVNTIRPAEIKEKIRKEYLKRTRKFLKNQGLQQKSHQREKYLGQFPLSGALDAS